MNNININSTKNDLNNADWVLYTQKALILSIDNAISCEIINSMNGQKRLLVTNISDASIEKILFLTNTDQNNNYLYLEDFYVNIFGFSQPLNIPGLQEITKSLYQDSDLDSFLSSSKTKKPFTGENITKNSGVTVKTFSEFIDILTSIIPNSTQTSGKIKYYGLTLNPDRIVEQVEQIDILKLGYNSKPEKISQSSELL